MRASDWILSSLKECWRPDIFNRLPPTDACQQTSGLFHCLHKETWANGCSPFSIRWIFFFYLLKNNLTAPLQKLHKASVLQKQASRRLRATAKAPVIEWRVSANQRLVGSTRTEWCLFLYQAMSQGSHIVGQAKLTVKQARRGSVLYIRDHNPIWLTVKDADTTRNGHTLLQSHSTICCLLSAKRCTNYFTADF